MLNIYVCTWYFFNSNSRDSKMWYDLVKMHISTNTTILLSKIVAWVHKFYLKYMRVWILAVLKILELFRLNFPIFVYKTGISFPLFCVILIYTFKCFLKVTE